MKNQTRRNLIVVDNFLEDPDGVRAYALEQKYERLGGTNWPGRDSAESHGEKEMTAACSEVVGEQLVIKPENKCSYFRITQEGQYGSQHIHFDPNPGLVWAGILYLTPRFHPTGGTKFWKHKETGWEFAPTAKEGGEHGIKLHQDMVKFFNIEGKDESKWIETDNISFKYNRLVMFNPFLWHSNGDWFGDMWDNSRLVQLFFFHGAG
tara:strand:+ start:258 stop:878 length:621 start_codon:yes stop_codon:yes gene_type:complete